MRTAGRILKLDAPRGAPQTFQIVKSSRMFGEDVNDQPAKIEQHPFAAGFAFAMQQARPEFLNLVFDFVADGFDLPGAETRAQKEIIGERGEAPQIEQRHFRRLLFLRGLDGGA